jgi:hypothetical protein
VLRSHKALSILAVAAVIAAGAALALLSSEESSSEGDATMATPEAPRPDETALMQLTQIVTHYGDATPGPLFSGELNGFTFQSDSTPDYAACTPDVRPWTVASEHDSSLLSASGLDFIATYTPDGFEPDVFTATAGETGHVIVGECGNTVIAVNESWTSHSAQFAIARRATAPVIGSHYSEDRLDTTTINGRPAIIVDPRFSGEEVDIYLRDELSVWIISSKDLSVDTLLQVAAGIR